MHSQGKVYKRAQGHYSRGETAVLSHYALKRMFVSAWLDPFSLRRNLNSLRTRACPRSPYVVAFGNLETIWLAIFTTTCTHCAPIYPSLSQRSPMSTPAPLPTTPPRLRGNATSVPTTSTTATTKATPSGARQVLRSLRRRTGDLKTGFRKVRWYGCLPPQDLAPHS